VSRERLISVVLPSRNGLRYLDEAIESWQSQSYPRWELILVDDGSTDGTRACAEAWCARDARIRVLGHEVGRGLPAALNAGFARAHGDYLTWTSDDNVARPHTLAALAACLDEHPDVGLVYSDYTIIDEHGVPTGRVSVGPPWELARRNCVGPSFLYRREVMARVGGYAEDCVLAEDYDFWLRAGTLFQIHPYHHDLYGYRVHPRSLTARHARSVARASDRVLARHLARLPWLERRERAATYMALAVRASRRGDAVFAARLALAASRESPTSATSFVLRRIARRARAPRRPTLTESPR
jgi:glycosyltransferase involved in cell wall biosynthesis